MFQIIESMACVMLEYWAILLFVGIALRLELRQSRKHIVVYSIISIMVLVVLAFLGQQENFFRWIMVAQILSILVLFQGGFFEKIFAFYLSYICYSIVSSWIQSVLALFYERSIAVLKDFLAHGIIFVIFAGVVMLYDKYRISETDGKGWYSFSAFVLSTVTCIASCLSITMILGNYYKRNVAFTQGVIIISLLMEFVFIVLAAILWLNQQKKEKLRQDNLRKEEYILIREQQYRMMDENEKALRKIKHDMDSHLDCVRILLEEKRTDEAKQYIENIIHTKNREVHRFYKSGNLFVDVLLSELQDRILSENVKLEIKGQIPANFKIEPYDITTLFGNLFHNAIEAVNQMKEGQNAFVHISFWTESDHFLCCIENSYSGDLKMDKRGNYLTTKGNQSKEHGYGLQNAKKVIKKYNGKMWINTENHIFKVEILIHKGK